MIAKISKDVPPSHDKRNLPATIPTPVRVAPARGTKAKGIGTNTIPLEEPALHELPTGHAFTDR